MTNTNKAMIESLKKFDPKTAVKLEEDFAYFGRVLLMSDSSKMVLIREVDLNLLGASLKFFDKKMVHSFVDSFSKNVKLEVLEGLFAQSKLSELVEKVTKLISIVRNLEKRGLIVVPYDDDKFV